MIRQDFAKRKYHTGARLGGEGDTYEYYRDDTVRTRNEATVLEMRDLIRSALSEAVFKDRRQPPRGRRNPHSRRPDKDR